MRRKRANNPARDQSDLAIVWPVPVMVNCLFEIKDSGPEEEHADYETDAMPSPTIVGDGDES